MFFEKELNINKAIAQRKLRDIADQKEYSDKDIFDMCILNVIRDRAQEELDKIREET